jgi:shikimate kinase
VVAEAGTGPFTGRATARLFLVGMMGAGKTTVGRMLAGALHLEFIDADAELERRMGATITNIFEVEGEAAFREREAQMLRELCGREGIVVATGGGAVLREDTRALLRGAGTVIYLEATADEILRRTRHDTTRPLLQVPDRRARVESLLQARAPFYREAAQLVFRSLPGNPRRLCAAILAHPRIAALAAEEP